MKNFVFEFIAFILRILKHQYGCLILFKIRSKGGLICTIDDLWNNKINGSPNKFKNRLNKKLSSHTKVWSSKKVFRVFQIPRPILGIFQNLEFFIKSKMKNPDTEYAREHTVDEHESIWDFSRIYFLNIDK